MNKNYQLGLLYLVHLLVSADGVVDKNELAALEKIKSNEKIPDDVYSQFKNDIDTKREKDIYQSGLDALGKCSEEEKLRAFAILYITFIFLCTLVACTQKPANKFSDPVLVKIAEFQDRRQSDSLYQFFNHENAVYRKDAVLAFASIQDTLATERIAGLLKDGDAEVRKAAAFALGQTGVSASFGFLSTASDTAALSEILESSGKVMKRGAPLPENVSTWGLYRLALRGAADSVAVGVATLLMESPEEDVRLGAAHFFARGPREISKAESVLQNAAANDASAYVRMAAVSGLRRINTPSTLEVIKKIQTTDVDYRVRSNAVRALQSFPIKDTKQNLFNALNDSNQHVGVAASEVIKAVATKDEFQELVQQARAAKNWRIQGNLFEAALAASNDKEVTEEIFKLYDKVENPYGKAALLTALGKSTLAYDFINEQLHKSQVPVVKSSAAGALTTINSHMDFNAEMQKRFVDIYKKAFETGDAAVMGTIAGALADSTLGYKKVITDFTFLYDAKKKLSLPKDNEALQPLEQAIAHFEGKKFTNEVKNEFNHPIDWELVKTIPADQKVSIKTEKGEVIIRLLVEEAPGSVANFVQLVKSQYFDAKNFHRVVPNFVIQGGCNRGDGWGSEDYSIRSEFSMRRYTEGSVGMASAGKDTEGTQWFITHSPTPHLDGRYTIFAVVEKGMDAVHKMEVGDRILKVELLK
jgi:cyclophilin family peptidyl-prolyl cis-trans isomerase/HEAT repeat protein